MPARHVARLAADQEVEVESGPPHVGKNPDAARRDVVPLALAVIMLIEDALEQLAVAGGYGPVPAHLAEGIDEEADLRAELMLDRAPVHQEQAGRDPEGEGEGRAELVQQAMPLPRTRPGR